MTRPPDPVGTQLISPWLVPDQGACRDYPLRAGSFDLAGVA